MNRDLPPDDDLHLDAAATDPDADGRLAALFARDSGPAPEELAEARLRLRRALERRAAPASTATERSRPALRSARRRVLPLLAQAAGFVVLIALLVPTLARLMPGTATPAPDFATEVAAGVRSFGARVGQFLPSLPPLDLEATLPDRATIDRALQPLRDLGDELPAWWPALHSDAR